MRQRQRQASGAVAEPTRPAPGHASAGAGTAADTPRTPPWDELYRGASPAQQQELLALAARQGVVYAHQLPAAVPAADAPPSADFLAQVLAGRTETLEPLRPEPVA